MPEFQYDLDLGALGERTISVVFNPVGPVIEDAWLELDGGMVVEILAQIQDKHFDEIHEACIKEARRLRESEGER